MTRLMKFIILAALTMAMAMYATSCSKMDKITGPDTFVSQSITPDTSHTQKPGATPHRLAGDPKTAVVYEADFAMRQNWQSVSPSWAAGSTKVSSNWAYLLNDPNGYQVVKDWYPPAYDKYGTLVYYASEWHSYPSFYTNMNVYSWTSLNRYGAGTSETKSHGGQCRYFANLILFRSGTFQQRLPAYGKNSVGYRPYSQIVPGDIIETTWANGHTAVVVAVTGGTPGSSVNKVVVVDSNYIGDEQIGMHEISLSGGGVGNLSSYQAIRLTLQ